MHLEGRTHKCYKRGAIILKVCKISAKHMSHLLHQSQTVFIKHLLYTRHYARNPEGNIHSLPSGIQSSFCWVTLQECLKIFLKKKKKINKNQNNMIEPKLPYFLIYREVIRYRKLKTLLVWEAYSIHLWVKRNKIN